MLLQKKKNEEEDKIKYKYAYDKTKQKILDKRMKTPNKTNGKIFHITKMKIRKIAAVVGASLLTHFHSIISIV